MTESHVFPISGSRTGRGLLLLLVPAMLLLLAAPPGAAQTGGKWVKVSSGNGLGDPFCVNPLNHSTLYCAAGSNSLLVSHDRGRTWGVLAVLAGGDQIKSVAVSSLDTNRILVGQEVAAPPDRIMRSTNGGATWTQVRAGNFYYWSRPVEYNPLLHDETVYTMADNNILRSRNFGTTWDTMSVNPFHTGNQGWEDAFIRPDSANVLTASDNGSGIWKSGDSGRTWRRVHISAGEVPALCYVPGHPGVQYAARWADGGGVLKSTDFGDTWRPLSPMTGMDVWGIAASETDPNFILTGTFGVPLGAAGGIYLTRDGGISWQQTTDGLVSPLNYACMVLDTSNVLVLQGDGISAYRYPNQSLALVSPDSGETWTIGSRHPIAWTATHVAKVFLDYTTDGGSTWLPIASDLPGDQETYNWLVPGPASAACKVRIHSTYDAPLGDQSAHPFSMIEPVLTLLSPAGGEVWFARETRQITWSSVGLTSLNVYWSTDQGSIWQIIAAGLPASSGVFSWMIPRVRSEHCMVKIASAGEPLLADSSGATFTVVDTTRFICRLSVAEPGGSRDTLEFGETAGATSGIDTALGETELPADPAPGAFDARWDLAGTRGTLRDLRDTLSALDRLGTFLLRLQPGPAGYPLTVTWDPSALPYGWFTIRDSATHGAIINVSMKAESTLAVPGPAVAALEVVHEYTESRDQPVDPGWNLLSLPLRVDDPRPNVVYPFAVSGAFTYAATYMREDSLESGLGYWLKFAGPGLATISGRPVAAETLSVMTGWTMIGALSVPIAASAIVPVPDTILASPFFGYDGGYSTADTLKPGRGYWLRLRAPGQIIFPAAAAAAGAPAAAAASRRRRADPDLLLLSRLTVSDRNGRSSRLYIGKEGPSRGNSDGMLPPKPPEGSFDVRFASGRFIEYTGGGKEISISGAAYPIEIAWQAGAWPAGSAPLVLHAGGRAAALRGSGVMRIDRPGEGGIFLSEEPAGQPARFGLSPCYPNPFNPATRIRYQIPERARVLITVYDMLGQVVATLVDEVQEAGAREAVFTPAGLAAGLYLCRMQAGGWSATGKMLYVR